MILSSATTTNGSRWERMCRAKRIAIHTPVDEDYPPYEVEPKEREWITGYYIRYGWTGEEKDYIVPEYASALYAKKIDPDTLRRCAGFEDMDNTLIYEGDYLQDETTGTVYQVVYDKMTSSWRFAPVQKDHKGLYASTDISSVVLPMNDRLCTLLSLKIVGNDIDGYERGYGEFSPL